MTADEAGIEADESGMTADESGIEADESGMAANQAGMTADESGMEADESGMAADEAGMANTAVLSIEAMGGQLEAAGRSTRKQRNMAQLRRFRINAPSRTITLRFLPSAASREMSCSGSPSTRSRSA